MELKKIKIKSDDCCTFAHMSYSLSQQLKLDDTFKDVEIERILIKELNNLIIYLNGSVWYNAINQFHKDRKPYPYPAEHVKNIKEQYKL